MAKYRCMLMFGPPGSGKGTQGQVIGGLPGFFHCSTGDVFRQLDKESELGKTFLSYSTKGELVPDELTIQIWQDFMKRQTDQGQFDPQNDLLILDGLPRTVAQAKMIEDHVDVMKVIYLMATDESAMVERLRKRAISSGRPDDADENIIRNRLRVYQEETRPVLEHYPANVVAEIDAMPSPAEVLRSVLDEVIAVQKTM